MKNNTVTHNFFIIKNEYSTQQTLYSLSTKTSNYIFQLKCSLYNIFISFYLKCLRLKYYFNFNINDNILLL